MYYSVIKIFNNLPHNIKDLANEIVLFQNALKRFLLINSFYTEKNILIIRDIALKIELTIGFKCFIIVLYL